MYNNIIIHAILHTAASVLTLLIIRVLLGIHTLAYHLGQNLQHRQMNVLAVTLRNSTLRQELGHGIIADAYLALAARLSVRKRSDNMLLGPRLRLIKVLEAMFLQGWNDLQHPSRLLPVAEPLLESPRPNLNPLTGR